MDDVTPEQWVRIDALFDVALDCPPDERRDFLEAACDDPDVRAAVLELLDATEADASFLDVPVAQRSGALWDDFADHLGGRSAPACPDDDRVGPYRLIEAVGHGGSSVVYRAERADGTFDQTVAIKLLTTRTDSRRVLDRFEHEQQVLAELSHPNIAPLYDGGATEGGRPYFVLAFVDGVPLDQYCDDRRLSVEARLRLFATVAEAVHHAHRNLVVHRDLKPSNILVTEEDGEPRPILLDFGIAKILDEQAPGLTQTGERWMTPEYAAPEQVKGESVTTATDVYQLGVVLYELITGHRPYRTDARSVYEIERAVCEEAPTPPSTAVTHAADDTTPDTVGRARGTTAGSLRRTLRGDLDVIVLKALRKNPKARYPSAEALVEDVRRYLDGQPVQARRGTWTYHTRKFVKRHTGAVVAVVLALVLAVGFGLYHTQRLAAERTRAQQEADKAEQVTSFLMGLFESNDPTVAQGDTVTARELLARGLEQARALDDRPDVQAEMFDVIGQVYHSLGQYDRAERLLERALQLRRQRAESRPMEVGASLDHLGQLRADQAQFAAADSLFRAALALQKRHLGPEHAAVAATLSHRADALREADDFEAARATYKRALALHRRIHGPNHRKTVQVLAGYGALLQATGTYDEAEHVLRTYLKKSRALFGEEHLEVATAYSNLATVLVNQGDYAAADSAYQEALTRWVDQVGPAHPHVATVRSNYAQFLWRRGSYDAALDHARTALGHFRDQFSPQHPEAINAELLVATILRATGRLQEAEAAYRRILTKSRDAFGDEHVKVASALHNLAVTLRRQGRFAEAAARERESLAILRSVFGPEHAYVASVQNSRAELLVEMDSLQAAETLFRETLALREQIHGPDHPGTATTQVGLGEVLLRTDAPAEAEPLLRAGLDVRVDHLDATNPAIAEAQSLLGACLAKQRRFAEAESLLVEAHTTLRRTGSDARLLRDTRRRLVRLYRAWDRPREAHRYRDSLGTE
jgi:serine/threonine-protein kinase